MSPAVLFGLVLFAGGVLLVAVAGPLGKASAVLRSWTRGNIDIRWWSQRGKTQVRVIAFIWVLAGTGIAIYGLLADS